MRYAGAMSWPVLPSESLRSLHADPLGHAGAAINERKRTFALCCVVDAHPRFYVECVLWSLCVRRHLPEQFKPFVYAVGNVPHDLLDWVRGQGVEVRSAAPVVEGSPHSNKIAPLLADHDADFTVVCDTDLYWVSDPSHLLVSQRVRAAPNNHANPPPRIFKSILSACGLERPYRPAMALFTGIEGIRETHINNISAGIVISPRARARTLAETWRKWAAWLVRNRHLLDRWAVHVDQVGFALAMEELGEDVEHLCPHVNTVLHLLGEISTCYALHLTTGHIPQFPSLFGADRTLVIDGMAEGVRAAVSRLNGQIPQAIEVIASLPSTRGHLDKFLNPAWVR